MTRGRRIFILLMLIPLISITSSYLYLFQFNGLESQVNGYIAKLIDQNLPLSVEVGHIDGSLVGDIYLTDILIESLVDDQPQQIIKVASLKTSYALSDVIRGKLQFSDIEISGAEVTVVHDSSGSWVIPGLSALKADTTTKSKAFPAVVVGAFMLTDGTVILVDKNDTTIIDNCSLIASFKGGEESQSIDIKQVSFSSENKLLSLETASGKISVQNDGVYLQDGLFVKGKTRGRLQGVLNLKEFDGWVDINIDNLPIGDVSKIAGGKLHGEVDVSGRIEIGGGRYQGRVNIGGVFMNADFGNLSVAFDYSDKLLTLDSLYGSILGGCAIDGHGAIDFSDKPEKYWLQAQIRNFNLKNIVRHSFASDLTGQLFLDGSSFSKATMELDLSVNLQESSFHDYHFHKAAGDLFVRTDSMIFADSFMISYFDNEFYMNGSINYKDSVDLSLTADLPDLKRYQNKLFIEEPAGRATLEATLTGLSATPDLNGVLQSDSLWLYGLYSDSVRCEIDIARLFTGQVGLVEGWFYGGEAWQLPYDSLYMLLSPDSNLLKIDSVRLSNSVMSTWAKGEVEHGGYPYEVSLDSLEIIFFDQAFANRQGFDFEVDSTGFNFTQAAISNWSASGDSDAHLTVSGRSNFDETMELNLTAENIRLLPWLSLFEGSPPIDGYLSAKIDLNGSFAEPEFSFEGGLGALMLIDTVRSTANNIFLGDLTSAATYADGRLQIDTVQLISRGGEYSAAGFLHTNLTFSDKPIDRFPNEPFDIQISAKDSLFDLVVYRLPSVDGMSGMFTADVRLSGLPDDPHLDGQALLMNGSVNYSDLIDPLKVDSAVVTMTDDRIIFDSLIVYEKSGRSVAAAYVNGEIKVLAFDDLYYSLDVDIPEEMPLRYALEDIEGVIIGKMHVEGNRPPKVTGEITLLSLDYNVPFVEEDEGSPLMLALTGEEAWDLDFDIDIASGFKVKNVDIDAEFSGQLTLLREAGISRFMGELELLRGHGYLFDKKFRLDQGGLVSFQGDERVNPHLTIRATTKLLGMQQEAGSTREQMELCINISGTLDLPEINPCENSQIAKEDILPLLVTNSFSSDTMQTKSAIGERVAILLSNQLTQSTQIKVGGGTLSIDEFDPASYGEFDLSRASITTGYYTSQLYLYNRHTLGQKAFQDWGFEYRLSRAMMLEGQQTDEKEYILNMKLHLEF